MALKIVRNDITRMDCDAVVNTANEYPVVGGGCDTAIYQAAGYDELLAYRKEHIGRVREGEVFLTPGFGLPARYIIHAVSPAYHGGDSGEERKLRSCYRKSLELARREGFKSIAFPLIATGSFHYPKEAGMRIAVDEINAALMQYPMDVYLVVFDEQATELGKKIDPELRSYIDRNYVAARHEEEVFASAMHDAAFFDEELRSERIRDEEHYLNAEFRRADEDMLDEAFRMEKAGAPLEKARKRRPAFGLSLPRKREEPAPSSLPRRREESAKSAAPTPGSAMPAPKQSEEPTDFYDGHESKLAERMSHLSDTFSEYLLYLIQSKGLTNAEVYKSAIVDKKVFSKIKNDKYAHPQKITALCLCVGARLNIDEARDLLARAGYALSPSSKTDVIFSYFIENEIYDMIQLDIQLEEYGEPCLIE